MSATGRTMSMLFSSRALMIGAVAAAAVAGIAFLGTGDSHQVVARFADADGLVSGNEIRVAGLQSGGTVDSVTAKVDPSNGTQYAEVVLNIDGDHWPLHAGTTFAVRPKGVLSNMFVALNPGPNGAPSLESGHVFGLDQTSSPVNLDEFSNLFDKDVRESLRTQIQEGVVAFGGSGADNTNALLHNANPLTRDLRPVTAVLAQRSPELDRLNAEFDTITAELAKEDTNLRGVVENGNTLLRTIANHATALQGTLTHAAGTLSSLDDALKGEEQNLATIFRKGPGSLDAAANLANQTNPVLDYINPYVKDLETLLGYFISATGYRDQGSGVLNSRVDATLFLNITGQGPNARLAIPCGGQQWDKNAYGPNNTAGCDKKQQLASPDGSSSAQFAPGVGFSGPAGGSSSQASPAANPTLSLFGGLFQ